MTPNPPRAAAVPDRVSSTQPARSWLLAVIPLVLLAGLMAIVVWSRPADTLRGANVPPIERLTFQRVTLDPDGIVATVMNDGPDPVTIAQLQIDEAYWTFSADRGLRLGHLDRTTLRIPYPWVEGETHVVKVLTSTGTPFEHEIAVAVATPTADARYLGVFTLIGLYVGVLPVAIGLVWLPFLKGLSERGMGFLLALTVGLLAFLLVDGTSEGFEAASALPDSFQGVTLFVLGTVGAYLLLEAVGTRLAARRAGAGQEGSVLALLVATGIGLHNFGEGLAIGSAMALGQAALGTLLIIGFTLHNTTEGLAIVAPLARAGRAVKLGELAWLGLIGGAPTIAGAWIGGLVYSPVWSVLFLALGVGAIAQVVVQITRQMTRDSANRALASTPILAGLLVGVVVMYVTGMWVG